MKTQRHRGEGQVKVEAEAGVLQLQAKEAQVVWQPPEARGGKKMSLPRALEESVALKTCQLWRSNLQSCEG
jgi:hypothetical protein